MGQRNTRYKDCKLGAQFTPRPTFPHLCVLWNPNMFSFENKYPRKDIRQQKWDKWAYFIPQFIMFIAIVLWNWASKGLYHNAVSFQAETWGKSKHGITQFCPAGMSSTDQQALQTDIPAVLAQGCAQTGFCCTLSAEQRHQQRGFQTLCSNSEHYMGWQLHLPHCSFPLICSCQMHCLKYSANMNNKLHCRVWFCQQLQIN